MDWTQAATALIVGLPAIIAAIGTFINTIHLNRLKEQNDGQTVKLNKISNATGLLHDENVTKGEKLDTISETTEKIAKSVNGDLEARFSKIEGKIDRLVDAMMSAKLLVEHPLNPSKPPSERG